MANRNSKAEIIADLRENIMFLRELGVESLAVSLADLPAAGSIAAAAAPVSAAAPAKPQPPTEPVERYVPTDIKPPVAARPEAPKKKAASRLAALPSLSNRRKAETKPPLKVENGGIEMTKAKTTAAATDKSLLGDIGPDLPERTETIEDIRADIGNCTRCPLSQGRTKIVQTTGNFEADLMFVGEAPGADEDASGEPFVGRAGQLLNKIIEAIGLKREDVCIGNINRCRPPGNRQPTLQEAHTCRPFLLREIAVIRPKVIVVLGNTALHNLLDTKVGITKLRGQFQDYFGVKVMPTFHPAYLLRDPSKKREVWEDMKKVRDYLGSGK